jgi:hypothetical protein
VITFLLQRFENKEEKVRIATLSIIKHVINTSGATPCATSMHTYRSCGCGGDSGT